MATDALPPAVQGRLDAQMALLNAAPACAHPLVNGAGLVDDFGWKHCTDCVRAAWSDVMAAEARP
jgi:hypothetical protein